MLGRPRHRLGGVEHKVAHAEDRDLLAGHGGEIAGRALGGGIIRADHKERHVERIVQRRRQIGPVHRGKPGNERGKSSALQQTGEGGHFLVPENLFSQYFHAGDYSTFRYHNQSKKIYAIKIINYFKENINFTENKTHINNINFCYQTVQQETSLMKKVSCSNYILKYYGSYFSRKTNTLWLIIEFCSFGSTIDLMFAMNRMYTEIEVATIIKMVLQGLIIIHEKNLIHRDIKGANILLSEDGYAKLGDFGVGTKLLDEKFRSSIKGSPYWMSPQVIQKEKYDNKTDIWSLGITCIELLQGEPPHSELSPNEVMTKIGGKNFNFDDFFRRKKSNYSSEFINFVSQCLQINPEKRATAKELIKHNFITKFAKDNFFFEKIVKSA